MAVNVQEQEAVIVRNGRVKVRIWTMTKNVNGINRADMIFAMAKEYALNLKRENHQRKQRRKARLKNNGLGFLQRKTYQKNKKIAQVRILRAHNPSGVAKHI